MNVHIIQTFSDQTKVSVLNKTKTVTKQRLLDCGVNSVSESRTPHNDKELYQIQKTYRKGNDQTPVNYMVRDCGFEINYLDKTYNMTHLQRKEVLENLLRGRDCEM